MQWVVLAIAGVFLLLGAIGFLAALFLEPKTRMGRHG